MAIPGEKDVCMDNILKTQSLLPWLDPGSSKIHLEVSLQNKARPPFRLIDSSSPLFNLIHASYRTPSGKSVKEVFLLVQKDHCSFTEKSLPFNNFEIDKVWQEASKFDGIAEGLELTDSLLDGSVKQAAFTLWQSLFYCEKRKCYFHPPCPQCGKLLELCPDDGILAAAGLPLYRTTLERFLFCPTCQTNQVGADFFSHDGDGAVYPRAKNRRDLVDGFEQLVKNGLGGEGFPCQTCTDQNDCYSSGQAFSRISPFAFYPFRMLIVDAAQLPAQDFISMLSGASSTEIKTQPHLVREPGRSACVESFRQQGAEGIELFFENDARRFLEILYLKIAILEQMAKAILVAQMHLKHPDLKLSIGQFWVDFPDFQGLLPHFWNFKVKPITLGILPSEEISFVRAPESFSLYSLALLWFNTMLVNREQTAVDVQRALANVLNKENGFASEPDFLPSHSNDHGVFGPENIFWLPTYQQLPRFWLDLWQKVLGLGWSLLQASYQSTDFSAKVFVEEVNQLAGNVKKIMFSSRDEVVEVAAEVQQPDDSAILQILLSLKEKWQEDMVAAKETVAPEVAVELESEEEVIGSAQEKVEEVPLEDDLEKTVMLSAAQLAALMGKGHQSDQENETEEISQKTVGDDFEAEDDLEKTVIMNLNDLGAILSENTSAAALGQQPKDTPLSENVVDSDLSETVIISLADLELLRKGKNGNK